MAVADWFRPKWRHSNPSIRVAAVKALTSPATLGRVAREDADASIRSVAVEMLSDQSVLGEVAKADADEGVRALALGRVTDAAVLADIVQNGRPGETRMAALARLTEPALLGEQREQEVQRAHRLVLQRLRELRRGLDGFCRFGRKVVSSHRNRGLALTIIEC